MARRLPIEEFRKLPLSLRLPIKILHEDPNQIKRREALDELIEAYTNHQAISKQTIIKHLISAFEDGNTAVRENAKVKLQWKINLGAV